MASKKAATAIIVMMVMIMAMLVDRSVAIDLCGMTQDELNECKPAVTKGNPTSPSQLCCTALQHADFACLCGYKNSPWLGSFGVDPELASGLPKECGIPNAPTC
ncbi:PREDICTED: putative lipid-transfer protein DIR1 [Camelina sativa]|uniref:Lipid-transfer protein DIR1 n=1 Tax=Camelina sativa TaxID=90675 RepID=A0ABM0X827_CAMSA|nr:PREDICTED: putative lipid-transfer protein DIR1 [Camelina sativa]